jgi:hypothetical protein
LAIKCESQIIEQKTQLRKMMTNSTSQATKQAKTSRYSAVSPHAVFQDINSLVKALSALTNLSADEFGSVCKAVPWVDPVAARSCVEAIKAVGQDSQNWVFLQSQDIMSGKSFAWNLGNGPIPKTGGWFGLEHISYPLSPGIDYYRQFVPLGETCPLVGEGRSNHYFSYSRCCAALDKISPLLGADWALSKSIVPLYQGMQQTLLVTARSRTASEVSFSMSFVGQGQIRVIPNILKLAVNGVNFFNVFDEVTGKIRPGSDFRGYAWQL